MTTTDPVSSRVRATRRQVLVAASAASAMAAIPGARAATPPLKLAFLHVNDVYEISPIKGQGGFGPLMTLLREARAEHANSITTLGGDFLSPSLMSGLTKGSHMVDLFNRVGIEYCVVGNHEFDNGPELAAQRISESEFPWLGTNVLAPDGKPFGGMIATAVKQVGDYKIGFFGILTPETVTLASPGPNIAFTDVIETARAAVEALKAEGAEIIVAMTHLYIAEDRALASAVEGIHLVLGGHDHDPIMYYEGDVMIFKAGYDAHYLGIVTLDIATVDSDNGPVITVLPAWEVRPTAGVTPDPEIQAKVDLYNNALDQELNVVVGKTTTELDSRRASVRTVETNLGDLIAEAIMAYVEADVAITNGGGIRGDTTYPAGTDLTRKMILAELPFGNVVVKLELKGSDILAALENGVSQVENVAGRFPQVAGLRFTWDPAEPPGARVLEAEIGGKPLDPDATYTVATNDYMAEGGDGYASFTAGTTLIDKSAGRLMATVVMDYVTAAGTVSPTVDGRITQR
jgi:2',3'-cyclic-nucleotide 2'-phosphodiesterase (5'-nucleotidase family)